MKQFRIEDLAPRRRTRSYQACINGFVPGATAVWKGTLRSLKGISHKYRSIEYERLRRELRTELSSSANAEIS